ncbi:ABC transporter permease [Xylophilus sp.]|uniref:ABC transporter permease n=1 Tax=Xylophilus sp. TaxID=2653893 RepID=UPI002D7FD658|nr:ABC transporter permease [Xylophilus sp.]
MGTLACAVSYGVMLAPIALVVWISFARDAILTIPPTGYTLAWYGEAWGNADFMNGLLLSLEVAVMASLGGVALGVAAAAALVRYPFRGHAWVSQFLLAPILVPGIVAGLAIYLFYLRAQDTLDVDVLGTHWSLVLAHLCLTVPWTVRLVAASLEGLDLSLEEAARNLGARRLTVFTRIVLPLLKPALISAALFGFIVSFENLEVSLPLVGAGQTTLPIAILHHLEYRIDPTIAAVSTVQIVLLGFAMVLTDRFVKQNRIL